MNDEAPKKRAWFQLHLSTCIVLMFLAGVIIFCIIDEESMSKRYPGPIQIIVGFILYIIIPAFLIEVLIRHNGRKRDQRKSKANQSSNH